MAARKSIERNLSSKINTAAETTCHANCSADWQPAHGPAWFCVARRFSFTLDLLTVLPRVALLELRTSNVDVQLDVQLMDVQEVLQKKIKTFWYFLSTASAEFCLIKQNSHWTLVSYEPVHDTSVSGAFPLESIQTNWMPASSGFNDCIQIEFWLAFFSRAYHVHLKNVRMLFNFVSSQTKNPFWTDFGSGIQRIQFTQTIGAVAERYDRLALEPINKLTD